MHHITTTTTSQDEMFQVRKLGLCCGNKSHLKNGSFSICSYIQSFDCQWISFEAYCAIISLKICELVLHIGLTFSSNYSQKRQQKKYSP